MALGGTVVDVSAKDDGDANTEFLAGRPDRRMNATANWTGLTAAFGEVSPDRLPEELAQLLLPLPLSPAQRAALPRQGAGASREEYLKSLTLALLSLPEYQLT